MIQLFPSNYIQFMLRDAILAEIPIFRQRRPNGESHIADNSWKHSSKIEQAVKYLLV